MAKDWKAEIERERALLAKSAITPEEQAAIDGRAEAEKIRAQRKANEDARRDEDLARRLDDAREALGDDVRVADVIIEGTEHTFIVKDPGAKAYIQWENDIKRSQVKGSGVVGSTVTRTLALVAVYDHNGVTDWNAMAANGEGTNGSALIELLKKSPGIATILCNEATTLAGLSREDRKSKG